MTPELAIVELTSVPLAISESHLNALLVSLRIAGDRATPPSNCGIHVASIRRIAQNVKTSARGKNIAILGLYGVICQRSDLASYLGGTSVQDFERAFLQAVSDETVGGILIDINSPGGGVYGVQELAQKILANRSKKRIVAVANSMAASAAYWIGCSAGEFYITPSGEAGSIGIVTSHVDISKQLENDGVKVTLIAGGKYKTEGNPYAPLPGDARGFMQKRVDDYYRSFVSAVAIGRAVSQVQVIQGMGQGRLLGSEMALREKLVDGVWTFDQAAAGLLTGRTVTGGETMAGASRFPHLEAARQRLRELQ